MRILTVVFIAILISSPVFAVAKVQKVEDNVWLIEDHTLPIVTLRMVYENSGAAYDPENKQGLASFTAQMLDEGAGEMDSLAFHRALESQAIRFGAEGGEDELAVNLQTLSEFKGKALELLTLAITKPRFDMEAIERVRASILSELKQAEESPDYLASQEWKAHAFGKHAYARPRRGTSASVTAITREDMQGFTAAHFSCSAKIIAFVGDITATEIRNWMKTMAKPTACNVLEPVLSDITPVDGAAPVKIQKSIPQTVVNASLPSVKHSDPRYYAVMLLNQILGGNSLTSRLGVEIRDKRGLAYYAQTDMEEFDHTAFLMAHFASRSSEAEKALGIFLSEVKKMREHGVNEQELQDAKSYLTGSFPLSMDNQNALSELLINMQRRHLGVDYLERRNNYINAVTLQQVNEAANGLLSHTPLVVMVGDFTKAAPKAP